MTSQATTDEERIMELFNQMTPENKMKAIRKYYELLEEQEREKKCK